MLQALPLQVKVEKTKLRIREWVERYGEDGVYVSFSGGKDSTVLLHIAREMYPNMKAMFVDTGLEYPEIREFVKTFDNVDWVKPKMNFRQVLENYGYPFISKEVSECVYGARKYLTALLEQETLATDRQTDRLPYYQSFRKITGAGEYQKSNKPDTGGETQSIVNSQELRNLIVSRPKGEGQRLRLARLMGMLNSEGQITAEHIPSKDRSMFSQERYKFFLEAPFEISSHCCRVMKKSPAHTYSHKTGRKAMTAQMASESRLRTQQWLMNGCNGFDLKEPISNPMSFWFEDDVLLYCYKHDITIAPVYGRIVKENEVEGQLDFEDCGIFDLGRPQLKTTGCERTGCVFCGYGAHLEKSPNRFERLKVTHPKLYDYVMRSEDKGGLGYKEKLDWINEHGGFDIKY